MALVKNNQGNVPNPRYGYIVVVLQTADLGYNRDTDTMRMSDAPGETEKAWDIIRRLDIEPELLLGY